MTATTDIVAVRCEACQSLFGYEHDDGAVLVIKSRDIIRRFGGGWVEGNCRRCALPVKWKAKERPQ